MRLIDVEKLLNDMKNELEKAVNDENMDKDDYMVIMTSAIALKDFVNRQPTAFDVEKVVSELEARAEMYLQRGLKEYFPDEARPYLYAVKKFDEAIDIVKKGGLDEDM